jgi:DNA-binding NtrC family response regulator
MAEAPRIYVVEDELAQREALRRFLGRAGFNVSAFATGEEAVERLAEESCSLLITDLRLPGMDGLAVLRKARELDSEVAVLLITAFASLESAVEALRLGAHDYLLKPLILEEVERKARALLAHQELVRENAMLRGLLRDRNQPTDIVAVSSAMKEVMDWVRRAAATRSTVLLTGETGTGKEVVARAIHRMGPDAEAPFLAINVAAVPDEMVESELFGHVKGAYTDAKEGRLGILRSAGKGTVFLDEIAELPPGTQAKLLRVLESTELRPLGSDTPTTFEARIIAATHRDLARMVEEGTFREDLLYRLDVLRIHLPPLRERPDDIPALVHELAGRHATRTGVPKPLITAEAMRALCSHPWRGNARELSNVLERGIILADEGRIDLDQLPDDIRGRGDNVLALDEAVNRAERAHISMVLRLCDGNRERAAEELGISPATLYRRLEKHGISARRGLADSQS